jgi:membrane-associated phospholipid phosphatase
MSTTLIYYFPAVMVVVFFVCVAAWPFPQKRRFLVRAILAAAVAVLISHLNRIFDLYPPHPYFPSGHMTLSLSMAVSLGLLRPWTLAVTLPVLVFFGIELVTHHFHTTVDVLGAVPVVLLVYALVFRASGWPGSRPLDSRAGSH